MLRFLLLALLARAAFAQPECRPCHALLYDSYQLTGMARSFSRATGGEEAADVYNAASATHYAMVRRDGQYAQRRWQIGFDGKETNAEELTADFVLGSGNHSRAYLSRTSRGALIELPLAWYSEKGGYWDMNPGYDTRHPPSHRLIDYECMFCHNAYPRIPADHQGAPVYAGELPQGIDCQRCHGSGAKHMLAAKSKTATVQQVRAAIVNPARLNKTSQMEVCMQCHLETASTRLPSLVRRFGRGPFSYVPGQSLGDFVLSFDHAPDSGNNNKFEIAGGAYRLRQSRCFLASKGDLTCETCHDPHSIPRNAEATAHYSSVCRQCHAAAITRLTAQGAHPADPDCVKCHMPKRRAEDAVHVVITDHLIQRRPPARDLVADLPERSAAEYRGKVVPYYPSPLPADPESALYLALAQVLHGSNLTEGIPQFTAALAKSASPKPEFYLALGDAWHAAGDPTKAAIAYRRAATLRPGWELASRFLGIALRESGQPGPARAALERAIRMKPPDAHTWLELGLIAAEEGRAPDALAAVRQAREIDSDLPDAWNALGAIGVDPEASFRRALQIDPYFAPALTNLAKLLADRGDLPEAVFDFERAAQLQPRDAQNRYEYALALVRMNRFDESQQQAEAAIKADAALAEAHELLGGLLSRKQEYAAALREYREAVRLKPGFSRAQLDLGAALAAAGDIAGAGQHFREAAKSPDARIAGAATRALNQIGGK